MKLLNVYLSEPADDVKKLVDIVSDGCETNSFDLNVEAPDYDKLVDMVTDADKTICWW